MKVKASTILMAALALPMNLSAQGPLRIGAEQARRGSPAPIQETEQLLTVTDLNRRIEQRASAQTAASGAADYRLGPEDVVEVSVFQAPELGTVGRISLTGKITLPLLGPVQVAGLTPREFELFLEDELRNKDYMHDPHVIVSVREMRSHAVSVIGGVQKPGVFQIQGSKTLIEVLSLASGLAEDAGDTVLVARGAGSTGGLLSQGSTAATPAEETNLSTSPAGKGASFEESRILSIDLHHLLYSGDASWNVSIYPGDIVKVSQAGIVYVVGDVKKPGGFKLKNNESITVLQAIALAEGLNRTAAQSRARIIRVKANGQRYELPLNLARVLSGKAPDPVLEPKDIVFVPSSTGKTAAFRGIESALQVVTGIIIWRR